MKTSLLMGVTWAILGASAAPTFAQTQTTTATTSSTTYVQTSKIVGTKVKTAQGEEIGTIKDIVLDRSSGCLAYTVLSTGGTTTHVAGRTKLVAVPWTVYSTTAEPNVLTVQVDRERIYNAPVFEYSRINEYSSSGWINNVYSYYGVSAQTGVSGQTSVTGGGTAGAIRPQASQVPSATGAPTAPPAATTTPMTTQSPAASAAPSPSGTASPEATRSQSREESTRGRAKATATPSSAHRHAGETTEESAAEGKTTTHQRSSRQRTGEEAAGPGTTPRSRHRTGEEATEPGTTPRSTPEQE